MQNCNLAFRSNITETLQKSLIHNTTVHLSAADAVSHLNVCLKSLHPLQALSCLMTDLGALWFAERGLKAFLGMLTEILYRQCEQTLGRGKTE